jgi:hypothetical protein
MRSQLLVPHRTCNQRCGYCTARVADEDRATVRTSAVVARLREILRERPEELVISGGEPAMRGDLAALVAEAKRAGVARVTLETNGTLIDLPLAQSLRRAGVDLARVNLSAWGDALDALTRDPGGFARAQAVGQHQHCATGNGCRDNWQDVQRHQRNDSDQGQHADDQFAGAFVWMCMCTHDEKARCVSQCFQRF